MNFHWFPDPLIATNSADGFEVLVHAFVTSSNDYGPSVWALCVNEEGQLHMIPHGSITLGFRYKRGRGWFEVTDKEED